MVTRSPIGPRNRVRSCGWWIRRTPAGPSTTAAPAGRFGRFWQAAWPRALTFLAVVVARAAPGKNAARPVGKLYAVNTLGATASKPGISLAMAAASSMVSVWREPAPN